jgi:hypothetical protein
MLWYNGKNIGIFIHFYIDHLPFLELNVSSKLYILYWLFYSIFYNIGTFQPMFIVPSTKYWVHLNAIFHRGLSNRILVVRKWHGAVAWGKICCSRPVSHDDGSCTKSNGGLKKKDTKIANLKSILSRWSSLAFVKWTRKGLTIYISCAPRLLLQVQKKRRRSRDSCTFRAWKVVHIIAIKVFHAPKELAALDRVGKSPNPA